MRRQAQAPAASHPRQGGLGGEVGEGQAAADQHGAAACVVQAQVAPDSVQTPTFALVATAGDVVRIVEDGYVYAGVTIDGVTPLLYQPPANT